MAISRCAVSMAAFMALWLANWQTLEALTIPPGYSALPLTPALEDSFIKVAASGTSYGATITKRVCVLNVESAWIAAYETVQLNYIVTGCDVTLGLLLQNKLPTRTAITKELGRCSATMTSACYASRVRASFEILEKSPSMIWYLVTEPLGSR